jgi:glyoxylase-like metal-dependent hydrolase (beta-lactamase superfamily II)
MHMTELTRRTVLTGATAAAAGALAPYALTSPATAAAPPAGTQAPGFYRYKVGDFEVTAIHDGAFTRPVEGYVRNISNDQAIVAAEAAYFPKGRVTIPFNPLVVNTGAKLVLIDAGLGRVPNVPAGMLIANMAAAGIDPKAIDIVVLSHLHPDHINGVKGADGALAFPNAEIKAPGRDWEWWMNDDNLNKAPEGMWKGYFQNARKVLSNLANQVTKYEWGKEVAPGITALDTSGHTPGHTSFAVASGSARILVQSDVTNVPQFFLRNPDWHVVFDWDPVKAAQSRRKFYDMASTEKMLVQGFHFPFPSAGYVEKDGTGFRLVPVTWSAVL